MESRKGKVRPLWWTTVIWLTGIALTGFAVFKNETIPSIVIFIGTIGVVQNWSAKEFAQNLLAANNVRKIIGGAYKNKESDK